MKKINLMFLLIIVTLLFSGCIGGRGIKHNDNVKEQYFFLTGEWRQQRQYDEQMNPTQTIKYSWSFPVYSNIQCTLRVREEYYNYDNETLEKTDYTKTVQMDGETAWAMNGSYSTESNIKKMRLVLERIDQGQPQEKAYMERDNIPKMNP
ncbi:MAG TPA: hypothetical protein DDW50_20945 [Firmicutes bacterium]|jgi:hypothetical protein|nr:hypothetical protein [Bacillota bacterium]